MVFKSPKTNQARAVEAFGTYLGHAPEAIFRAPGRVNLIGEHTDYNDGFVLPCAIDYDTVVAISPRDDATVRALACDYNNQVVEFSLGEPICRSGQAPWSDYLRGVTWAFRNACADLGGFDISIAGNIPAGAGLSSSAAYEVAVATALNAIFGGSFTPANLARMAQKAENEFVGCRCGIMDQLISALGRAGCASLIDCRNLAMSNVRLPDDWRIFIVDSKVKRGLVDSEYNDRRRQCEAAASAFGVSALRDLKGEVLQAGSSSLDQVSFRRARHVVTENARTLAAADALDRGDMKTMSQLMGESHASMRDDFEITIPQIDFLVDLIGGVLGHEGGVRMTGGGFGGCVVALVPADACAELTELVRSAYGAEVGFAPEIHLCEASEGAGALVGRDHD